jgi:hypothetical protein
MFVGGKGRANFDPPKRDEDRWQSLIKELSKRIYACEGLMTLNEHAKALYGPFHIRIHASAQDDATARARQQACKYASLYAILGGRKEIELDDMEKGILLAAYNCACMDYIRKRGADTQDRDYENQLRKYLEGRKGKKTTLRDFYNSTGVSVQNARRAAAGLASLGYLRMIPGKQGSVVLELADTSQQVSRSN